MENVTIRQVYNLYVHCLRSRIKNIKAKTKFENQLSEGISLATEYINDPYHMIRNYHIFTIYEPKERLIMSLPIVEKIVNHYFTLNVLAPKLEKYLDIRNCAARTNMGTSYAINLLKKYINKNKWDDFYVLKIDIKKYFYNIDHNVLKSKLKPILEDDEYIRLCCLLDSTNAIYINNSIKKIDSTLPLYEYDKGLPIGNLSSQILSIFYLSGIDHYIVHNLHLKYYIRYMDDFIILSKDKDYLKKCSRLIIDRLKNEYKLDISPKKTFITKGNSFNFLGYHFFLNKNNKLIVSIRHESRDKMKKKLRMKRYEYDSGIITFNDAYSSVSNYLYAYDCSYTDRINLFNKYFL